LPAVCGLSAGVFVLAVLSGPTYDFFIYFGGKKALFQNLIKLKIIV
jgi:hypothetical protein